MTSNGLINGNSAAVSATGASGVEMMQAGFSIETIGVGVLIWVICKALDAIYAKITKK